MATAQHPPVKSSAPPQYESFVEEQLARARRRLRGFDAAAWGLLLGSIILAYGLSVSLADLLWDLPTSIRLVCWGVFVATVALGAVAAVRRLLRTVNPLFLARQLEHTVPDAKNSVINWLDLREESLPPVIRGSLGRRAAKDLSHADPEKAISGKLLWWLGGVAGFLLLIQLGWLIAAPGQVWSLLQRAFFPFDGSRIALRTTLTLLKPQGGNVAVPANQPVVFRVQAAGYVPPLNHKDSLKLHFRYHQNEPFEERLLHCDADGIWTTTVHADQVRGGFWYKITGGDAQLPPDGEYRVDVHAAPQVLRFEAAFKYRDYLKLKERTVVFDKNVRPSIKELRGTEVTLTLRTNRVLQQCILELKQGAKLDLAGEPVPGEPEAWRFKWLLDQSGEFRILFKSKEGEENVDRQACKVEVIPDLAPEVVMTKPAQDLSLPANGTLVVDGYATDDFGVKAMQLRLKLIKIPPLPAAGERGRGEGMPELKAKPYRPEKSFELVNGKYPLKLDYSDFVALDGVKTATGEPFPLAAGMELEYWLDARDNCDYPNKDGNLGQSIRYKLTITPPEIDKSKADGDRQAAQDSVGKNQGIQDEKLKGQNAQAKAENMASGGGGSNGPSDQSPSDVNKEAEKVQQAIDKANNKGETKGNDQPNSDVKDKGPQEGSAGDAKGGEPQPKDSAAADKNQGNDSKDNQPGAGKDQKGGKGDQPDSKVGEGKGPGDASGQPKSGQQKDGNPDSAKSDPKGGAGKDAAGKGKGSPDANPKAADAGQQKGDGNPDGKKTAQAPPGETKSKDSANTSGPKNGPGTMEQAAGAKGGDPTNEQRPPDAKPGPPDPSQKAGNAKAGDRNDAKMDDVSNLREQLEDAGQRDVAQKSLEKIAEQAADPKVREAAQKMLDQAQAKPGDAKTAGPQGTSPSTPEESKLKGTPDNAKDAGQAVPKNAQAKNEAGATKEAIWPNNKAGTAKSEPPKAGGNVGKPAETAANHDIQGSPNPVDDAAARRAADLQLESLKKQVDKLREKFTPEVMKDLKWSAADREEFLQKMLADALLRQQQQKVSADKLPMPGSFQSKLPSSGPQLLQNPGGSGGGPVIIENPEPPPGVREAMKAFQNKK